MLPAINRLESLVATEKWGGPWEVTRGEQTPMGGLPGPWHFWDFLGEFLGGENQFFFFFALKNDGTSMGTWENP